MGAGMYATQIRLMESERLGCMRGIFLTPKAERGVKKANTTGLYTYSSEIMSTINHVNSDAHVGQQLLCMYSAVAVLQKYQRVPSYS